jgi:quercetin dioxygenase-like cupin family protein
MDIRRNGTQASVKGPTDWFTGTVRIDPLCLNSEEPARATGAGVTFEPGARTAWHTHPLGQTLIVTAGRGRVRREDGFKSNQERASAISPEPLDFFSGPAKNGTLNLAD